MWQRTNHSVALFSASLISHTDRTDWTSLSPLLLMGTCGTTSCHSICDVFPSPEIAVSVTAWLKAYRWSSSAGQDWCRWAECNLSETVSRCIVQVHSCLGRQHGNPHEHVTCSKENTTANFRRPIHLVIIPCDCKSFYDIDQKCYCIIFDTWISKACKLPTWSTLDLKNLLHTIVFMQSALWLILTSFSKEKVDFSWRLHDFETY